MKQFKAGQKVRILSWEEMKEKYPNSMDDLGILIKITDGITAGIHYYPGMNAYAKRNHIVTGDEAKRGVIFECYSYFPEMCEEVTDE